MGVGRELDADDGSLLETKIPGLLIVTNVTHDPDANPARVVEAQRYLVKAARGRFDVVILDTAPLLSTNDALELAGLVDSVLLVARAERTTSDHAQRAVELLERIEAPTAGVVLVGGQPLPNRYFYESDSPGAARAPIRLVEHEDSDDALSWIEEELFPPGAAMVRPDETRRSS